jgi:putative transposase
LQAALYVHLAWGTWERAPLLVGELERGVQRGIADACAELKARVIAVGGIEDHIHLLVQLPPVLSVADLARRTKGSSAHLATHQLAPGAFFKWQRGYGSVTISPSHTDQVARYIARQREHHVSDRLMPPLEQLHQPGTPPVWYAAAAVAAPRNECPAGVTPPDEIGAKGGCYHHRVYRD